MYISGKNKLQNRRYIQLSFKPRDHFKNEKDAVMSSCLDRKEVRCATSRMYTTQPVLPVDNTGRLFLAFGGPVGADR